MPPVLDRDALAATLGIEPVDTSPGRAVVRMVVRPDMANAHGTCHGGALFTLADVAFALACNSHGPLTVAAAAQIEFVAPAAVGATLTATCQERLRQGRAGVYDTDVVDADGTVVAVFRGRSRTTDG